MKSNPKFKIGDEVCFKHVIKFRYGVITEYSIFDFSAAEIPNEYVYSVKCNNGIIFSIFECDIRLLIKLPYYFHL